MTHESDLSISNSQSCNIVLLPILIDSFSITHFIISYLFIDTITFSFFPRGLDFGFEYTLYAMYFHWQYE